MIDDDLIDLLNIDPKMTDFILDHLPPKVEQPNRYNRSYFIKYIRGDDEIFVHKQTLFLLITQYEEQKND